MLFSGREVFASWFSYHTKRHLAVCINALDVFVQQVMDRDCGGITANDAPIIRFQCVKSCTVLGVAYRWVLAATHSFLCYGFDGSVSFGQLFGCDVFAVYIRYRLH